MSPNQPKTPLSSFRLSEETKESLRVQAERAGTSMTEVLVQAVSATEHISALGDQMAKEAGRYPFDAHTASVMAFRTHMDYEVGQILPNDVIDALDYAVRAANPIIREAQHYESLRRFVFELTTMDVAPEVVEHFRSQMPEQEK